MITPAPIADNSFLIEEAFNRGNLSVIDELSTEDFVGHEQAHREKRDVVAPAREPVEQVGFARFLVEWQGVGSGQRGADAVLSVVEQEKNPTHPSASPWSASSSSRPSRAVRVTKRPSTQSLMNKAGGS